MRVSVYGITLELQPYRNLLNGTATCTFRDQWWDQW